LIQTQNHEGRGRKKSSGVGQLFDNLISTLPFGGLSSYKLSSFINHKLLGQIYHLRDSSPQSRVCYTEQPKNVTPTVLQRQHE